MTMYIDLEVPTSEFKQGMSWECGCSVYEIIDENTLKIELCSEHTKELNLALKQSIISKSKK